MHRNTEKVTILYSGADGCVIKADFEHDKGCQIGRYNQVATGLIVGGFKNFDVCYVPGSKAVTSFGFLDMKNFEGGKCHEY